MRACAFESVCVRARIRVSVSACVHGIACADLVLSYEVQKGLSFLNNGLLLIVAMPVTNPYIAKR